MLNRYLTQGETSIVGYTTGVFDLFHIGHLNILKRAKDCCDELIVGITTDELTEKLKGNKPIIPFVERAEIISSIKYVDTVIPQRDINELKDFEKLKFKVIFKGGDWKGTDKWNKLEPEFNKRGVKVIFFPYTKSTSSTKLRELINKKII
ncbi:MAG: adenylyltransferase/cytidyltransferase family protein [Candidatus Delongbacteria bacterium]|nr:adenylyltransferase/cytidyltransferase family protein [Candidatus Delongbacteria bacterium]